MRGGLKVHLHRTLPEDADIRSCVFRRDGRGGHVSFAVAVVAPERRTVASSMVGVDLGLKVFAYCSDGVIVPTPQIARRAEKELRRRRQRALLQSRKAGAHLIRIDPRNTSQKCSGCGELVPKTLAVRTRVSSLRPRQRPGLERQP